MRGVPLFILAIIILSVPIQIALAHEDDSREEAEFGLHAAPAKLTVHRGGSVSSIISLRMEDEEGDSPGQAQLTLTWDNRVPSDTSYSFKSASIREGQSSVLTFVTHLNSTIGNFHLHVWASIGSQTESVRMALKIKQFHPHGEGEPDFTVSADPLYLTTMPGGSASSMIIVNSLRGFHSPVNLMLSWESTPAGVSVNLQPSTLTPSSTSNLTLTTSKSTPTGLYGFEIIGTSGDIVHEGPDMWLNVSTTSIPNPPPSRDFVLKVTTYGTINPGETVNYNITLAAVNGFNQQVSLSVNPATLEDATITLSSTTATPANPPVLRQLQIQTQKTIKNGTYSFLVAATNGSLTHQATIFLTVLPSVQPTPPALQLTLMLSKYSITLGDTITVSGQFQPPQGLGTTPLLLLYRNMSNSYWRILDNILTNTTSGYAYDWTPGQSGTFIVRAIWAGNATNNGAFSNIAILQVNPVSTIVQPGPAFPWFWLAIAAIIIIGVATAVALRIRRKPTVTGPTGPTV